MMSDVLLIGTLAAVIGMSFQHIRRGYARRRERTRFARASLPLSSLLIGEVRKYALALVSWSIAQGDRSAFSDSLREKLCRAGLTSRQAQEGFLLTQEVFIVAAFVSMMALIVAHIVGFISLSVTWLGVVIVFFCISLMPYVWLWGKGREHTMRWEEEIPLLVAVFQLMRRQGVSDEAVINTFGRWYGDCSAPQLSFARQMVRIKRAMALGLDWRAMMERGVPLDVSPSVLPIHVRKSLQGYIDFGSTDVGADDGKATVERYCAYLGDTMRSRVRVMRYCVMCLSGVAIGGMVVLFT